MTLLLAGGTDTAPAASCRTRPEKMGLPREEARPAGCDWQTPTGFHVGRDVP